MPYPPPITIYVLVGSHVTAQCQETPRPGSQAPGRAAEGGAGWTVSVHGQPWDLPADSKPQNALRSTASLG